jgi:hypothetical protein
MLKGPKEWTPGRKKVIIELTIKANASTERLVEIIGKNLEFGTSREAFELALDGALGEGEILDFEVRPGT